LVFALIVYKLILYSRFILFFPQLWHNVKIVFTEHDWYERKLLT